MAAATTTHAFTVEDVEYLRHGGKGLLARIFKPAGAGPFPAVVELHGGAWANGDRLAEVNRHNALAKAGIVVVALDFRQGSEGRYPAGLADINYAIRWVKANARDLRTRPDLVATSGQSSGGHLAMLAAMRPNDPRYTTIALPAGSPAVDASVRCVVMSWPVINPLSRYRHAVKGRAESTQLAGVIGSQEAFWGNEDGMRDGSCLLALERGEKLATPPALWIQAPNDVMHDYHDPDYAGKEHEPQRFEALYRKAGGTIDLVYYEAPLRFTSVAPDSPPALAAFERIAGFLHQHLPTGR